MKFQVVKIQGVDGEVLQFSGEINYAELLSLQLDKLDRHLLLNTTFSAPAADQLLMLEMLFRRDAERQEVANEQ